MSEREVVAIMATIIFSGIKGSGDEWSKGKNQDWAVQQALEILAKVNRVTDKL